MEPGVAPGDRLHQLYVRSPYTNGCSTKRKFFRGYSGTRDFKFSTKTRSNLPLVTSLIVPPVDITQVPSHIGLQGTSSQINYLTSYLAKH